MTIIPDAMAQALAAEHRRELLADAARRYPQAGRDLRREVTPVERRWRVQRVRWVRRPRTLTLPE
ncbi:hypothetical protein acdb102_39770 [Acidothermaceae bacterium B102]|nr:hypothetical protein acdb102_39770 [Acidothermaceae bacterium B102]